MQTDTASDLTFPILIGDIGGTNARFALLIDAFSDPVLFPIVPTTRYASIEDALLTSVLAGTSLRPRSAIIAVAAPVKGDAIPLTNAGWVFRPNDMLKALSLEDVIIINDFEAQALAIVSIGTEGRDQIGPGTVLDSASCAVLGPGTGLGVAGLVHAQHSWIPVPGEGGHVDVGPRSRRDEEIWPFLEPIEGRISAEQLLCGRGIVNIYRAVCASRSVEPHLQGPADVTTHALAGSDAACVDAMTLFATYLGRVAGDMAMVFMARGGVFLAGGISQKILPILRQPEFRQAFEDKAPHGALLKTVPTFVITHPTAALSGLAAYARVPARFGVAMEGRRWRT